MSSVRRQLVRLGISLGACIALLGVGEWVLRRSVPDNGVTIFRAGTLPGLASELRPGFETVYRGHPASINSMGFRGPEVAPRREGELRVALVGDSFTFGNGVEFEDTLGESLASELRERGRDATVFNCGVPGYNAQHVAITARQRALELDLDLLVYVFFANDLEPSPERREVPTDAVIDKFYGFPLRSALGQWCAVQGKRWLTRLGVDVDAPVREAWSEHLERNGPPTLEAIEAMRSAADARGVAFAVAVYPFLAPPEANAFTQVDDYVISSCAAMGVPCIPLRDAYPEGDALYGHWSSVWDSHPDGDGHRLAAALLAPRLLKLLGQR